MALSLGISFSAPCSLGEHFRVTATLSGAINKSRSFDGSREKVLTPPSDEDIEAAVYVFLKLMVLQLSNKSNLNIRNVVQAKSIDLTVVG